MFCGCVQITPDMFDSAIDCKFAVTGSDKRVYPLVAGGEKKQVTYANRRQFAKALISFRLREFQVCFWLSAGFSAVSAASSVCFALRSSFRLEGSPCIMLLVLVLSCKRPRCVAAWQP